MIYQHPLAYLLGLEGVALLRACAGEFDRDFMQARTAEISRLLAGRSPMDDGVVVDRLDTVDGYRVWSTTYDEPRNSLFDVDEPVIREIIDTLPVGTALDAACGTGRHAEYLTARGYRVIGVDSSPDMLARARTRVPEAEFLLGDLHRLPVADDEVDLVVCSLALTHVAALGPVIAEFARVLRPGGHVVISDVHSALVFLGSVPRLLGPGGQRGLLSAYRHLTSDYLSAALPLGLQVRRCAEPRLPDASEHQPPAREQSGPFTGQYVAGPWEYWPWSLQEVVPEAARAAYAGTPLMIIWHFQLAAA